MGEDLPNVVVVAAVAAAAVAAPPTTTAEDVVAAAITEAEAAQTATPPSTNMVATTLVIGSMRYIMPRKLPTLATATASPPTLDFALYYYPRSSSLSRSTSTTRSKTHYNVYGAMP
jgi:hypothetical protein